MKTRTKIVLSFKLSVIACITSLMVVPEKAFASWCEDWQERQTEVTVLETKDVKWDGENLRVRYWNEMYQRGFLELVYWTKDGKKFTANHRFLGDDGNMSPFSGWRNFSAELRYAPSKYQLTRVHYYCKNIREPTLWEKINN